MEETKPRTRRALSLRGKLLLAAIAPVAFLLLLEGILAAVGYRVREEDAPYERVCRAKPAGTVRIVVLGGSAAAGFPFDRRMGPVPLLRALLRDVAPGQRTEVVNAAVNALPSEGVVLVGRRLLAYHPDVFLIYCGHNEFFSDPNLLRTVEQWRPEEPSWVRRTRTFGLFQDIALMLRGGEPPEEEGLTRAERAQAGAIGSPRNYRPDVLAAPYEAHLRELVRLAQEAGVKVVLCTLACNLRDAVPTLPKHRDGLSEADEALWRQHYEKGRALVNEGRHREAVGEFEKAAALDDTEAALLFDSGRSLYALGEYARARERLAAARDQDYMPMRATTYRNDAVRRVGQLPGVVLVDVERAFDKLSSHGCPGDEWFFDYMHPLPEADSMLARGYGRQALEQHGLLGPEVKWDWATARSLEGYEEVLGVGPAVLAQGHALIGRRCAEAEAGGLNVAAFRRPQFVAGLRARGREHFAAALRLDPQAVEPLLGQFEPYTLCYLALAYDAIGQPDMALELCGRVLDVIPTFVVAYQGVVAARETRGETEKAAAARARLAEIERADSGGDFRLREQGAKEKRQ